MHTDDVVRELDALDAEREPSVRRFDSGGELRSRVAVLPSAFNPPTTAHLGLLELAGALPGVHGIAALLSTRNVDKGLFGATLPDRVGMLLAVREQLPSLVVFASNAARIADQAVALRRAFPAVAFDFVVGHDTLVRLFDARYYDDMAGMLADFFAHHRVIATNRGGASLAEVESFLREPVVRPFRAGILVCELDEARASLSSTAVRNGHEHAIEAVAPPVARYIAEHGLYAAAEAAAETPTRG
jgi:nicotinamide-nucleotide adenylyltransferase